MQAWNTSSRSNGCINCIWGGRRFPMVDFAMMRRNVRGFMSLFHSDKPVVCKVHGFCVAGGTDMALCSDLLAPGFGEIIGGSERIHDEALLRSRIEEHGLPVENYRWYLDLRKYGSVPHSGFGLGIERAVLWISGLPHIREAIPFPRMLHRIYP